MNLTYKLFEQAAALGTVLRSGHGLNQMEIPCKTGVYWGRFWQAQDGNTYIVIDLNGEMIETARPGGVMLDIGANVGRYSRSMAQVSETVYAFEPDPTNFAMLFDYMKYFENVVPVNVAVSNQEGTAKFYRTNRWGNHSINRPNDVDSIDVPTITIDKFVKDRKIENITGIKIDIEGHEQFALEGAFETLKRENPIVALETHENINEAAISKLIHDAGYDIWSEGAVIVDAIVHDSNYLLKKPA